MPLRSPAGSSTWPGEPKDIEICVGVKDSTNALRDLRPRDALNSAGPRQVTRSGHGIPAPPRFMSGM
jgi:hypothetical protein